MREPGTLELGTTDSVPWHCTARCSTSVLWVWVDLAICEALVMEEPGRGSECLLNQHFFDSVALENPGVER